MFVLGLALLRVPESLTCSHHFIAVSSISWRTMLVSYEANQGWNTEFLVSWAFHRLLWGNWLRLHVVSILFVSVLPACMHVHLCCLCYPWVVANHCVHAGKLNLCPLNKYSSSLSHLPSVTFVFRLLFLIKLDAKEEGLKAEAEECYLVYQKENQNLSVLILWITKQGNIDFN